ncbi:MAG: SRPBCC family protein [bacterium]
MFNVYVEKMIEKDIHTLFDVLADHAGYARFRGVKAAKLLEPGETEENGLGALREIDLGTVKFVERITCFERPHRLDYKIEQSSPLPFKHELGSITLEQVDGGTKVVWVSRGTIAIPLVGPFLLDKKFERQGNQGFGSVLKQIAQL